LPFEERRRKDIEKQQERERKEQEKEKREALKKVIKNMEAIKRSNLYRYFGVKNTPDAADALIQHGFVFDKNVTESDVIQFVKQQQQK
jgi:ribosomal protein L9